MSSEDIVNTHDTFMRSLCIKPSDDDKRLPYLYWTPKLHKSPVKHRFIAGSSKCTTKQLCVPLLVDSFPYFYENEFLDKLIKEGKRKLARKFSLSYHYIDDLISFNNKRFKEFIFDIYPKELTISETTKSTSIASYLDLLFIRDKSNNITTKLSDKRDAFGFHIMNFSSCQAMFHQHQPMVSMHLSSFAMSVVAQIIVTFYYTTLP